MARGRKRKDIAAIQVMDDKPTDEELFIKETLDKPFWAAKKLSVRRSVRFNNWLASIAGNLAEALGEPEEEIDWPVLLSRLIGVLGENELVEILSIASGHTAQEIEGNFDYKEALDCLADFVEINSLGSAVTNFFGRIQRWLPGAEATEQEGQPSD